MNLEQLRKIREKAQKDIGLRSGDQDYVITVSMGTSGIAAGAREVMRAILDEVERRGLDRVRVKITGSLGLDDVEPVIQVDAANGDRVIYVNLTADKAREIVAEHIVGNRIVTKYAAGTPKEQG